MRRQCRKSSPHWKTRVSSTKPTINSSSPPGCAGGGECCGLKWSDIDFERNSIHIQRNVVKLTGEDVFTKPPKTAAGDRYVYFSPEMESQLKEYRKECVWQADAYENRKLAEDDFVFRKHYSSNPMTPSSFTWRFKLILKKNGLPEKLNVHRFWIIPTQ